MSFPVTLSFRCINSNAKFKTEVFHGPSTTLWLFRVLSSSLPFWSSVILPAAPLSTNQVSLQGSPAHQGALHPFHRLPPEINWCAAGPLQNNFYFLNIGLWTINHAWKHFFTSYFGISFFLPFTKILFGRFTSAFDSSTLKIPKFSNLSTTFLMKYRLH